MALDPKTALSMEDMTAADIAPRAGKVNKKVEHHKPALYFVSASEMSLNNGHTQILLSVSWNV